MNVLRPQVIRELSERKAREGSPILSVYLSFDPTDLPNRRGGHKVALDCMLKDIESQLEDGDKIRHFREDAAWVVQRIEFHQPKGRSLLLFCDVSESFYFDEDLPIRLANQAWYGSTPYIRPLIETRDEYERYGVVLLDRERAHFFTISMGNVEEMSTILQSPPFKHRASSGRDQMRSSQTISQRRAETWNGWFFKDVSTTLHDTLQKQNLDRIILAGPEDVTAELERLLPKAIASRVAARVRISVTAKESEVLDLVLPIIEKVEQERELATVNDLVTIAQKTKPTLQKAVLGLNATLDAVNQGRVLQIVYPGGLKQNGYHCGSCGVLLDQCPGDQKCPYCSNPLEVAEDIVWLASERVLEMGGRADEVKGEAALKELEAWGKIGAFLR